MMGQQTGGEAQLFYAFNLDEYVPSITSFVASTGFSISARFVRICPISTATPAARQWIRS